MKFLILITFLIKAALSFNPSFPYEFALLYSAFSVSPAAQRATLSPLLQAQLSAGDIYNVEDFKIFLANIADMDVEYQNMVFSGVAGETAITNADIVTQLQNVVDSLPTNSKVRFTSKMKEFFPGNPEYQTSAQYNTLIGIANNACLNLYQTSQHRLQTKYRP